MPRLTDLLEWLSEEPALASVWVLLDIKTDDDPEVLMPAVARAIASVLPGEHGKGWRERIVVGCWNVRSILFFFTPFHPM
jgi:phosphatidylglycerol phospholipase C